MASITTYIVALGIMSFLFLMFLVSRYKKFKTNEYVIVLRNGSVHRAGAGGRLILLPLIDEVIVIPTTIQQTSLEAREKVISKEYQNIAINGHILWQVMSPAEAFTHVSWDASSPDYVENVIKNATESIIRTTCANMLLEQILRERTSIINAVVSKLHEVMDGWGVTVRAVEIKEVEVIDPELKKNMEAQKKITEEERAKLRHADMVEITKTRDIEVMKKTGLQEQAALLDVEMKSKEREVTIEDLERKRIEIEADAERKRLETIARAEKTQIVARAEGEAVRIKEALIAEAEGILQQIESLRTADERFFQLKFIEELPEIYKRLNIDRMFIIGGDGQSSFGSIANTILPFVDVAKDFLEKTSEKVKMVGKTEEKAEITEEKAKLVQRYISD